MRSVIGTCLAGLACLWPGGLSAAPAGEPLPPSPPGFRTLLLEGRPSPPATLEAVSWMAGRWEGEGLGGLNEEIWSEPRGGAMMGMYRLLKDGRAVFYEFLMLVEEQGSLVLKLKHFNPDFSGWEEKQAFVDFPLVKVEERAVHFDGLSFVRQGDDATHIHLRLRSRKTGQVSEEEFRMRRVR